MRLRRTRAAAIVLASLIAHGTLGAQRGTARNDLSVVIARNAVLGAAGTCTR